MKIKCAVFDADGTLLDSMTMWKNLTYTYAAEKGVVAPEGIHRQLNTLSMEQCAAFYQEKLGINQPIPQIVEELAQCALRGYRDAVKAKPGAKQLLTLLKENGIPAAIATASDLEGVKLALRSNGMEDLFSYMVSCTQMGTSKETPDIFLHCAEHFHCLPQETVVFEDSAYALKTAKAAGFLTVGIFDQVSEEGESIAQLANRCFPDFLPLIDELTPPGDSLETDLHRSLTR
jgi:HAD superfamily hydrolase (TIGR01509 family)